MKTTEATEIYGMVGRLNDSIHTYGGELIGMAVATAKYKILAKGPKIVGYTYTVKIGDVVYTGKAKGPGEGITLRTGV